jgi:hypothetical protein
MLCMTFFAACTVINDKYMARFGCCKSKAAIVVAPRAQKDIMKRGAISVSNRQTLSRHEKVLKWLHMQVYRGRYFLLLAFVVWIILCGIYATKLEPTDQVCIQASSQSLLLTAFFRFINRFMNRLSNRLVNRCLF